MSSVKHWPLRLKILLQQMAGLDQVAQAMESIKTASTQNVASTKQTEVAAKNIGELGRKLTDLVALYKV